MPSHVYLPQRDPLTVWDRARTHPWENTLAALAVLSGPLLIVAGAAPDFRPSNALAQLSSAAEFGAGVCLTLGGIAALVGLHWPGDMVSTGWKAERAGWLLCAGGWATVTIAVVAAYPGSALTWLMGAALGVGGLIRAAAVHAIERATRAQVAALQDTGTLPRIPPTEKGRP